MRLSTANSNVIDTTLKMMESSLGELAMNWRSSDDEEAHAIVYHYQAILRCMLDLGFCKSLMVEAELPDEYLPQEYLNLFK